MNIGGRKLLGEILIEHGLISPEQLQEALDIQANTKEKIGSILVGLGYLSEPNLMAVLEFQLGIPYVNIAKTPVDSQIAQLIPENLAVRHKVIPIGKRGNKLILAMVDPLNVFAIDDIRISTGMDITPVLAAESDISMAVKQYLGVKESLDKMMEDLGPEVETREEEEDIDEIVDEGPIVKLVNSIIAQAVASRASDIHVEPQEKEVLVRYRIDGVLRKAMSSPRKSQAALTSRLKIMANMDIAEKRVPQDGRIPMKVEGKDIDLRVNSLPTVYGEKIVMRILDKSGSLRPIDSLGMQPSMVEQFRQLITQPHGMLLITGPTGSGKTTVLYSVLQELNDEETNIISVEDPVEYTLPGINQVNVNAKAGLTFASGLRAILRQDPDVVMVGEIRDPETVSIAIGAALTGHLVLSTLHTNSASATITRMMDMGIEPFLISSSIVGVMAQRLVRKICPHCKEAYQVSPVLAKQLELGDDLTFYRGRGCRMCNNSGYQGRIPVQELLVYNQEIKDMVLARASTAEIERAAVLTGMQTLKMDGMAKAKSGLTTLEEALTVVSLH
ncbi:MAG TPA: ATPase, T2SS/T4P/T4SS family [Verrucomicrobiae bacterium]|nr:ATPase, T2SS/T4P/T4SS family [Verrucomicrobiae bacterium]